MEDVFAALLKIMKPYATALIVKHDAPGNFYLDTHHLMKNKKPMFFGAVKINKNYVSYHLMPVYVRPALLSDVSPALRKRMQGKSCFNFTVVDDALFEELAALTKRGYADYVAQGFVGEAAITVDE